MDNDSTRDNKAGGCLASVASALLTAFLLFLNGGVVLAALNTLSSGGLTILRDERFSQFVVLIGPVILVVIEWMMIDYLRARIVRRRGETET